jgi:hypothetical protein
VRREDLAEISRRLEEEYLLHRYDFEPVQADGRELWVSRIFGEVWTREQILGRIEELKRWAKSLEDESET